MVSQKSLEFQLDKLLGDTSFEMDVDALIQAPDRAFLDSYLTSLQAKNGPMDVQPQEGVEQYQGNVFSTFSSAPITTGAFNDTAAAKTGPQIITTGDYSDLQLADLAWDAEEEEVQGNNIDPSVIDKNKQRKRRIRTQQQQNQNKLAQQRYRYLGTRFIKFELVGMSWYGCMYEVVLRCFSLNVCRVTLQRPQYISNGENWHRHLSDSTKLVGEVFTCCTLKLIIESRHFKASREFSREHT
eukprot:TRINITY_DN2605_c0_g4_i3.p2 TRINITY_DN2605_c0_g4~~TRINITY_DN2605_c0_g4_i3.p2  ORF type:complete len:241 (-),score=17.97 TRINITY_DN2605_c0_g4_i3:740-1462(-)